MAIPKWKILTIYLLAAVATVLAGLTFTGAVVRRSAPGAGEIARIVEQLLTEHRGEIAGGRIWKVHAPGSAVSRTEHRVLVPPEFDSIDFNHALAQRLAPAGAKIVATERSKEATVTMHVVVGGATVYSLTLVTDPEFHTKENEH